MKLLRMITQDDRRAALITCTLFLFSTGVSLLLIWAGNLSLLGMTYLLSAILIGGWLYSISSPFLLGFIIFLWFLTPFLRRVIDYIIGSYTPPSRSFVLLTPFAVTLLTLLDIPRFGSRLVHRRYLPFLLCVLGVFYGYLVGLVKVGPVGATMQFVRWLPPLLTGIYVLNRRPLARQHVKVIKTSITLGVLLLGLYGIVQFYMPPEWDAFWMRNADMNSIGHPYPYQIRIFSMLDSPGPFAATMGAGLILLFYRSGLLQLVAAVPGYVSFLLAEVRGAWIGWVVAVGAIIAITRGRIRTRLLTVALVATTLTVPVVLTGPIADRVGSRMETLENIEEDGSVQARLRLYRSAPIRILLNPVGWGLGSRSMDSGILTLFWQLGWAGSLLYLSGLALLLRDLFRGSSLFAKIVLGIAASYCFQFFAGGQLLGGITGVLFWTLTSLSVALHMCRQDRNAVAA